MEIMGNKYLKFLSNVEGVKNRVLLLLYFYESQFLKYEHLASVTQKFIQTKVDFPKCSMKKVLLKISQNSQKNTCVGISFSTLKKRPRDRFFLMNFTKFLTTLFFIEHIWWLLLSRENKPMKNFVTS